MSNFFVSKEKHRKIPIRQRGKTKKALKTFQFKSETNLSSVNGLQSARGLKFLSAVVHHQMRVKHKQRHRILHRNRQTEHRNRFECEKRLAIDQFRDLFAFKLESLL
jgi:hypothetical protein